MYYYVDTNKVTIKDAKGNEVTEIKSGKYNLVSIVDNNVTFYKTTQTNDSKTGGVCFTILDDEHKTDILKVLGATFIEIKDAQLIPTWRIRDDDCDF